MVAASLPLLSLFLFLQAALPFFPFPNIVLSVCSAFIPTLALRGFRSLQSILINTAHIRQPLQSDRQIDTSNDTVGYLV
jgi:hypothetical protein